jgi:ribonucleoside-diphosphate reductase alpha chain
MTVEGAPHLKKEHYEVFDTAALCGKKGTRYINWMAHVLMMASTQPFISGAISKTINMPSDATYNNISEAYVMSWMSGLKSITIYRDQSKLSQPLSAFSNMVNDTIAKSIVGSKNYDNYSDKDTTSEIEALEKRIKELEDENKRLSQPSDRRQRKSLPSRRGGYIQKTKIGGHSIFLHTGEYEDGKLGEIFIDMHREGAAFRSLLNNFAIAISLGLQYGVPLEEYVDAFVFTKFEPNGMVKGHKYIKMVTSVVDYIFRDLAITYLNRKDLGQVKPEDLVETEVSSPKEKLDAKEVELDMGVYGEYVKREHEKLKDDKQLKKDINDLREFIEEINKPKEHENLKNDEYSNRIGDILAEAFRDTAKAKKNMNEQEKEQLNEKVRIRDARLKGYEGDPCPTCGSLTLIRNGTCMKCDTCGSTTGCS